MPGRNPAGNGGIARGSPFLAGGLSSANATGANANVTMMVRSARVLIVLLKFRRYQSLVNCEADPDLPNFGGVSETKGT